MVARSLLKARDEVRATRPRGSGTHGKAARQLGLTGRGQRGALFVPYAHPLDLALPDGIAQRVQQVADQAEDLLYANLLEDINEGLCDGTRHLSSP